MIDHQQRLQISVKADGLEVFWGGTFRCVYTMPRRKDINNEPPEAVVAAHKSGKVHQSILKQSQQSGIYPSTQLENIQDNCQSSQN